MISESLVERSLVRDPPGFEENPWWSNRDQTDQANRRANRPKTLTLSGSSKREGLDSSPFILVWSYLGDGGSE